MALTRVTKTGNITVDGNVGIETGTVTPRDAGASTLQIGGNGTRSAIKMHTSSSGTGSTDGLFLGYDSGPDFYILNSEANGEVKIGTNNSPGRLVIDASGYVTTPNQPSFMAHGNNGWQISAGGANIPFGGVTFNNSGSYNTSTSKFTAPVAGKYMFITTLYQDNSYDCRLCMTINGAQLSSFGDVVPYGYTRGVATSGQSTLSMQYIANLNLNDYVEVRQRASYGDARIYTPHCHFGGHLIG